MATREAAPAVDEAAAAVQSPAVSSDAAALSTSASCPASGAPAPAVPPSVPTPDQAATAICSSSQHVMQDGVVSFPGLHPDSSSTDLPTSTMASSQASSIVSRFLKGKEREWDAVSQRAGPLTLLELPEDILRLIVKEITHTNDLTSLALTNSTLHNLAVPHIYARFDIVWPDANMTSSDSKSVDALTYGLSTLCLGSTFARATQRLLRRTGSTPPTLSKFLGSNYARYTRKFSLGNGPNDWVAEYMITKESGKMLGTLVALAVAKMVNLETFVWDMPTGVLSDVFMALGSLPGEEYPVDAGKLDRVWIRWHDNNEAMTSSSNTSSPSPAPQPQAQVPLDSTLTPIGIMLPPHASHPKPRGPIPYSESTVEYPTFSVLPPLRSLTVLDIDELPYLDEMAVLIERSKDRLRELRVGIASKATHRDFVQTWDGPELHQVDHDARWPGGSRIGERRLGGVLGVLVGRVYDVRRKSGIRIREKGPSSSAAAPSEATAGSAAAPGPTGTQDEQQPEGATETDDPHVSDNDEFQGVSPAYQSLNVPLSEQHPIETAVAVPSEEGLAKEPMLAKSLVSSRKGRRPELATRKRLEGKLRLHTLELERIPLSMQICSRAIDWTCLTNLTILECAQHENLWKVLRRQFQPTPMTAGFGIPPSGSKVASNSPLQYQLCLKRIHTDVTSTALIAFIKETLAPNTLEVLFLQDRRKPPPPVTIEMIFKGAIKRHRSSLRKLLLDSSTRNVQNGNAGPDSIRWRNWVLSTEILLYITSGRLANIKELAVSLDYKDWHTFLQRLPNVPQLRSLNIPYIADHVVGNFEPKELAMQIADIVTLRPEIQLCYVGISTKCFEILEVRPSDSAGLGPGGSGLDAQGAGAGIDGAGGPHAEVGSLADGEDETDADHDSMTDEEGDGEEEDEEETDEEDDDGSPAATDPDETQSEGSEGQAESDDNDGDDDDDDDDSFVEPGLGHKTRLRLREILFYDDKVAIFKARHGKL